MDFGTIWKINVLGAGPPTGDEPYNKEQGGKKKGNSDDGKRKLPMQMSVRTKK